MKMKKSKKVIAHLKDDIKNEKKAAKEDRELIKVVASKSKKKHMPKEHESKKHEKHEEKESKGKKKFERVMHEYKEDKLHSGSKKGPKVTNKRQAFAIAYSEKRKAGKKSKK